MATPFVPTAIFTLLSDPTVSSPTLRGILGDPLRVFPIRMAEDLPYPALVYHELEELTVTTKDASAVVGYEVLVFAYSDDYLELKTIQRLTRKALNLKMIDVDDVGVVRLHYTGSNDVPFEDKKNIMGVALSFRAVPISVSVNN